jgi:hypothetical protein
MLRKLDQSCWTCFDHVDAPEWLDENTANTFCSVLNSYIPREYSVKGCRYHMLNHFQGGLYFHLLNRPAGL